jgi:protein MpaA
MISMKPVSERATLSLPEKQYGTSVRGQPLTYYPAAEKTEVLLFAAIHGEEPETTALLSRSLRSLSEPSPRCSVILAANPDGVVMGTRGNANGVELNRNFPTSSWSSDSVLHRWEDTRPQEVRLSPGSHPASEPEVAALIALIEELKPEIVVSLHGPLGWIDDPLNTPLSQWFAKETGLKVVGDCGYPTPGSFGSWCAERKLPVITYELEKDSFWNMPKHLEAFQKLLMRGLAVTQDLQV